MRNRLHGNVLRMMSLVGLLAVAAVSCVRGADAPEDRAAEPTKTDLAELEQATLQTDSTAALLPGVEPGSRLDRPQLVQLLGDRVPAAAGQSCTNLGQVCDTPSFAPITACGGFSDTCDSSGTQSGLVVVFRCLSNGSNAVCTGVIEDPATVTRTCSRVTNGLSCGSSCDMSQSGECVNDICRCPNPPPNIAFVTSTTQPASYGGVAGADNLCQTLARGAGLAGTYRAWLSTNTASAIGRLGSASGWVRTDGKPVANTLTDLAMGKFYYPMRLTESQADVLSSDVHTATLQGLRSPFDTTCVEYTIADNQFIDVGFTEKVGEFSSFGGSSRTCSSFARLYCFGIDRRASVVATPPPSFRRAFLSVGAWRPDGGLASADALCAADASAAQLPGTYKALLATTSSSAAARFNTSRPPWARVDGVLLSPTAAAFFSSSYWDAALNVDANGRHMLRGELFWVGATSLVNQGAASSTCNNWTATDTAANSCEGTSASTKNMPGCGPLCNVPDIHLVCLQE